MLLIKKFLKLLRLYKIVVLVINVFKRRKIDLLNGEIHNNKLFESHLKSTFGDQKG